MLTSDLKFISTPVDEHSIGIAISYKVLLHHTIVRLLESINESEKFVYPLRLKLSDGLDGSGSHKIYNQQHGSPTFNTKNYILFAFKLLSLTHEPISNIDIISASPLHSYTYKFRWFMLVIYHLQSGTYKWAPTSKRIQDSLKFVREFLLEKTGIKIDQVSSTGGTTPTGNVARSCFIGKNNFIEWVSTLILLESRPAPSEHLIAS